MGSLSNEEVIYTKTGYLCLSWEYDKSEEFWENGYYVTW